MRASLHAANMRRVELGTHTPARRLAPHRLRTLAPRRVTGVNITVSPGVALAGELTIPWGAGTRGIVVLAGGLGSSRRGERCRDAARSLGDAGMATLAIDLLTTLEGEYLASMFDSELLAGRLLAVTGWLATRPETGTLSVGYFAPGGAARAALQAAERSHASVCAVLARGDGMLADGAIADYGEKPVLLIAGEGVPGERDHKVAELATRWFGEHIADGAAAAGAAGVGAPR